MSVEECLRMENLTGEKKKKGYLCLSSVRICSWHRFLEITSCDQAVIIYPNKGIGCKQ